MPAEKQFPVFGEIVRILVSSASTGGSFSVVTQTCAPGGGPPPHQHTSEDEFFAPLEGEFEIFAGAGWIPLTKEGHFAPRGRMHTFRNCGQIEGTIMIVVSPGGLEKYLESISTVSLPGDMERLLKVSAEYGIAFA